MSDENDDDYSSSYLPSIVSNSKKDEPKKIDIVTEKNDEKDEKPFFSFKDMVIPGEVVDEDVTENATKTHQNILPIQTKVDKEPCNLSHDRAHELIETSIDEVAQFQLDPHHNYEIYTYTPKF